MCSSLANKTGFFTDLLIFILDLQEKVYCQQVCIQQHHLLFVYNHLKHSRISTLEHHTYFGNMRLVKSLDLKFKYKWQLIFIEFFNESYAVHIIWVLSQSLWPFYEIGTYSYFAHKADRYTCLYVAHTQLVRGRTQAIWLYPHSLWLPNSVLPKEKTKCQWEWKGIKASGRHCLHPRVDQKGNGIKKASSNKSDLRKQHWLWDHLRTGNTLAQEGTGLRTNEEALIKRTTKSTLKIVSVSWRGRITI